MVWEPELRAGIVDVINIYSVKTKMMALTDSSHPFYFLFETLNSEVLYTFPSAFPFILSAVSFLN